MGTSCTHRCLSLPAHLLWSLPGPEGHSHTKLLSTRVRPLHKCTLNGAICIYQICTRGLTHIKATQSGATPDESYPKWSDMGNKLIWYSNFLIYFFKFRFKKRYLKCFPHYKLVIVQHTSWRGPNKTTNTSYILFFRNKHLFWQARGKSKRSEIFTEMFICCIFKSSYRTSNKASISCSKYFFFSYKK